MNIPFVVYSRSVVMPYSIPFPTLIVPRSYGKVSPFLEEILLHRKIPLIHSSRVAPPGAKLARTVKRPHLKR